MHFCAWIGITMLLGAAPLAHMITFLMVLGVFVLGLIMVLVGRKSLRPLFWPGVALMSLVGALLVSTIYQDAMMEWNPRIREDAQITGKWSDGRETVTLHADHRFDLHSPNEGFSGNWSRFDHNLRLKAEGLDSEMRFVMWGSDIYLMSRPPDDPDDWDGTLGLKHVPSGSG